MHRLLGQRRLVRLKVTYEKSLGVPTVHLECLVIQLVPGQVGSSIIKSLLSGRYEVAQRTFPSAKMVIDSESLLVLVQRSKLSQEWEVLLRVLCRELLTGR